MIDLKDPAVHAAAVAARIARLLGVPEGSPYVAGLAEGIRRKFERGGRSRLSMINETYRAVGLEGQSRGLDADA